MPGSAAGGPCKLQSEVVFWNVWYRSLAQVAYLLVCLTVTRVVAFYAAGHSRAVRKDLVPEVAFAYNHESEEVYDGHLAVLLAARTTAVGGLL